MADRSSSWRRLAGRLGLRHPIIQGPMAGGIVSPALVGAVCEAGGLGSIAGGYLEPEAILRVSREVRALTARPFAINLFARGGERGAADSTGAVEIAARLHRERGLPPPQIPDRILPDLDAQLEAVLQSGCSVLSFTFGVPSEASLARARAQGIALLATATTVAEGRFLQASGVNAVVAQGSEAGGQRASFLHASREAVGTFTLVPQMTDALGDLPVIAAGGIMDGRGLAAAAALGAAGVQLGTAFLTSHESSAAPAFKEAVLHAQDDSTVLSTALTGRWGRSLANALTDAFADDRLTPPFPVQHALTLPVRRAALERGDTRWMGLFAGQGSPLARARPAAELVRALIDVADRLGL